MGQKLSELTEIRMGSLRCLAHSAARVARHRPRWNGRISWLLRSEGQMKRTHKFAFHSLHVIGGYFGDGALNEGHDPCRVLLLHDACCHWWIGGFSYALREKYFAHQTHQLPSCVQYIKKFIHYVRPSRRCENGFFFICHLYVFVRLLSSRSCCLIRRLCNGYMYIIVIGGLAPPPYSVCLHFGFCLAYINCTHTHPRWLCRSFLPPWEWQPFFSRPSSLKT